VDPEYVDEDAREVIAGERRLLDPGVRAHPDLVRALLHAEFFEYGQSGTVWDVESILEALAAEPSVGDATMIDPQTLRLSADAILLTFRIVGADRASLRSSVWVRSAGGTWLLRFHQGTPT
jgi:hypothetical protein